MTVEPRFIPRITPMKGELPIMKDLTVLPNGRGVTYPVETPDDRDRHGALWIRMTNPPAGRPIPVFRSVHPRRAAEIALDLRCQGCGGDPDRNRAGVLFFLQRTLRRSGWPDTEYTHHPPVCLPCAREALLHCTYVKKSPALRVANPRPWGVEGLAFELDRDGNLQERPDVKHCGYDDLRLLPWMLCLQPVIRLSRCTVVDIHKELFFAGLPVT